MLDSKSTDLYVNLIFTNTFIETPRIMLDHVSEYHSLANLTHIKLTVTGIHTGREIEEGMGIGVTKGQVDGNNFT